VAFRSPQKFFTCLHSSSALGRPFPFTVMYPSLSEKGLLLSCLFRTKKGETFFPNTPDRPPHRGMQFESKLFSTFSCDIYSCSFVTLVWSWCTNFPWGALLLFFKHVVIFPLPTFFLFPPLNKPFAKSRFFSDCRDPAVPHSFLT